MLDALEIGYVIKDARSELGMTQARLAEMAGISKRCLWSLELGQNPGVQLDKLLAVLKVLGLDLSIVAGDASDSETHEKNAEDNSANSEKYAGFDALSILTGGQNEDA